MKNNFYLPNMLQLLTLMLICLGKSLSVNGQLRGAFVSDPTTVKDKGQTSLSTCETKSGIDFMSHYFEDQILLEHFYKNKCGGTVVEMGGFNGKSNSNSWYFEHALGWKTLLAEPFPSNYDKMIINRPNAINIFGAICLGETAEFQIAPNSATGGIASDMSDIHIQKFIREKQNEMIQVPCHQITNVLVDNGIDHVDVFFLDVEGAELTALQTIDWSRTPQIDMFVIEMDGTNPLKDEAVRAVLRAHGYVEAPFNTKEECEKYERAKGELNPVCLKSEIFILKHVMDQFGEASTTAI